MAGSYSFHDERDNEERWVFGEISIIMCGWTKCQLACLLACLLCASRYLRDGERERERIFEFAKESLKKIYIYNRDDRCPRGGEGERVRGGKWASENSKMCGMYSTYE